MTDPRGVTVLVYGQLRDPASAQGLHDAVTVSTRAQAEAAGSLSHRTYLNPEDPRDFLAVDEWPSVDAFRAFASDPRIEDFFGRLFEGEHRVRVYVSSGWTEW